MLKTVHFLQANPRIKEVMPFYPEVQVLQFLDMVGEPRRYLFISTQKSQMGVVTFSVLSMMTYC